jgi:hypothetical protein
MRTLSVASISVAALVALALFDAKPADARKGMSFSAPRPASTGRSFARVSNKSFVKPVIKTSKPTLALRSAVKPTFKPVAKIDKVLLKKGPTPITRVAKVDKVVLKKGPTPITRVANADKVVFKKGSTPGLVQKSTLGAGKLSFAKLPLHKASTGNGRFVGRLSVPKDFKPKLTLALAPRKDLQLRLSPFVQRHWRKAFFWVAVAGVGYVTVPELYYDRFYRCAGVDNPDYEDCISILSYAALEEEEAIGHLRTPMPSTAAYRYTAKVVPTPEAKQTCSFEPFVERQWNRSFVWVQIPQTGNVTVPEDYYDRFSGRLGAEPPDYPAACKVLVEAAAADTVATTGPDLNTRL